MRTYPLELESYLKVTISIGIAERTPDIETPDVLIRLPDQVLYAAKAAGRDSICFVEGIQA